ncbi:MAG: ATP-binding protein [Gemmatimonadales bacterium]
MRWNRAATWIFWSALLGLVTAAYLPERETVLQAQVVLTYLLVVLGASVSGGRSLGFALAFFSFLLIDYFFQPPFDSFSINKSIDWIVLLAFLAVAGAATQLLALAHAEAREARERTGEVASLSRLGAETLNATRPEDALEAVAAVIRQRLGVRDCTIVPGAAIGNGTSEGEIEIAAGEGLPSHLPEMPDLRFRLTVHGGTAGVLTLSAAEPIHLAPAQRRFLETLAYYGALAAERVRLTHEASHAAALREAGRMKDIVLASVSHDLRTPLSAIKALAGDPRLGDGERARAIEEQADRLTRLVGDLLELSKLQVGAARVDTEPNTAEDLLGALDRQLAAVRGDRELIFTLDLAQPALIGRFNFVQSLRALSNLVENALRLSPAARPVELSIDREGEFLAFRVADHGPGVAPADRERIFDAFYRPAGAIPDAGRSGLGLNIAKRLAEVQGGSVTYEPRPGGGSIFTLRLPALDLEEPQEEGEK